MSQPTLFTVTEAAPPPRAGYYQTILADPPWAERGGGQIRRGANRHYELMTTRKIAELPVNAWAETNAHLYLWVTNNFLPDGLAVMEAWGFRYVTSHPAEREARAGPDRLPCAAPGALGQTRDAAPHGRDRQPGSVPRDVRAPAGAWLGRVGESGANRSDRMKTTKDTKVTKVRSKPNRGPRRRAIVALFCAGFQPVEIARLFDVKLAVVWTEIRKALA